LIRLFTTWYAEQNSLRASEYVECLQRNLACPSIDEVCVLAERSEPPVPAAVKLRIRLISRRPDYKDYFDWINALASPSDVSAIANADIFFDETVGVFELWPIPPRTVLALSRWDVSADGMTRLYDHNDSQDTWIFRGPIESVRGDFPTGVPRCDNRIAKELELAGYTVLNPSFSLRSFHLHAGSREAYGGQAEAHFVPPPYGYVWPHNLLPLHRTLLHNAIHSRQRLDWRFDRRLWSRRLRLHWIKKAMDTGGASSGGTADKS